MFVIRGAYIRGLIFGILWYVDRQLYVNSTYQDVASLEFLLLPVKKFAA